VIRTTLLMIAAAIALLASGTATAQRPPAHLQSTEEALAQDAGEYARAHGVALDEAERRLRALDETVAVTDRLQQLYRDRLAGIAIEHHPDFRIVVLLTGDAAVPDQAVEAGGMIVPIVFRTGALATRDQLVSAIKNYQAPLRATLIVPPAMGVDMWTGALAVVVGTADVEREGATALAQRLADMTRVPVRISTVQGGAINLADPHPHAPAALVPPGPVPSVEGGAQLVGVNPLDGRRYLCTAGFVVTDGARTGIATAAHCLDSLSLIDPDGRALPLGFVGQWGWGFQDVQVNVSPQPLAPLFFADSAKTLARPVAHARTAASTRAGDWVCHRGERTGYSCSEVELVDFAPAGDLCGGACLPQWITAAGPTCKGGDSGAPVFAGTGALGILKGGSYRADGSCAFYFYMSVDYLPTGWSLLEQPETADQRPGLSGPISRSYSASGTP